MPKTWLGRILPPVLYSVPFSLSLHYTPVGLWETAFLSGNNDPKRHHGFRFFRAFIRHLVTFPYRFPCSIPASFLHVVLFLILSFVSWCGDFVQSQCFTWWQEVIALRTVVFPCQRRHFASRSDTDQPPGQVCMYVCAHVVEPGSLGLLSWLTMAMMLSNYSSAIELPCRPQTEIPSRG